MNLPDELYRAARVFAVQEGRTVTSVLEEALRRLLDDAGVDERAAFHLTTLPRRHHGEAPIDVGDNSAVRQLLDSVEGEPHAHA